MIFKTDGKTSLNAERSLSLLLPEVAESLEIGKPVGLSTIKLSDEAFADLERAREILSHVFPEGNSAEVLGYVLKDFLKRKDPLLKPVIANVSKASVRKVEAADKSQPTAATTKHCVEVSGFPAATTKRCVEVSDFTASTTQHYSENLKTNEIRIERKNSPAKTARPSSPAGQIPAAIRRAVLQRARGRCEFENPLTKRKCGTRFQIQIDHIHPKALGGSNSPENLRALCGKHNRLRAERTFGAGAAP